MEKAMMVILLVFVFILGGIFMYAEHETAKEKETQEIQELEVGSGKPLTYESSIQEKALQEGQDSNGMVILNGTVIHMNNDEPSNYILVIDEKYYSVSQALWEKLEKGQKIKYTKSGSKTELSAYMENGEWKNIAKN